MSISREKLNPEAITQALGDLPEWSIVDNKLHREYKFPDFTHAFGFMAAAATVIEKMDHHPEWFNVYGTVRIDLWTHSSHGITELDITQARKLETLARPLL